LDFVLYQLTLPASTLLTNLGPVMGDLSTNITTPQRMIMPATCTYDYWQKTKTCALQYTGLQSLLNADITIRAFFSECSAPYGTFSYNIDCLGTGCTLLTAPQYCTSDASCQSQYGSFATCFDAAPRIDSRFDILYAYFSGTLFGNDTCSGKSSLISDFQSFAQNAGIAGTPTPNSMGICSLNFTYLLSSDRADGLNITEWAQNQFVVSGDSVSNSYLVPWPLDSLPVPLPTGTPASTGVPGSGPPPGATSGSAIVAVILSLAVSNVFLLLVLNILG